MGAGKTNKEKQEQHIIIIVVVIIFVVVVVVVEVVKEAKIHLQLPFPHLSTRGKIPRSSD